MSLDEHPNIHFAEVHCVMHRQKTAGRQSGRSIGYIHDNEMIPIPTLVLKKTMNRQDHYDSEKEAYSKIHSIHENEQDMKQHFARPLGYNDEERSLFISFESPINYFMASTTVKQRYKDCFIHQFIRVVTFMDKFDISWEYHQQNLLISNREFQSSDGAMRGPLLIFIDFGSRKALQHTGAQFAIDNFCSSFD